MTLWERVKQKVRGAPCSSCIPSAEKADTFAMLSEMREAISDIKNLLADERPTDPSGNWTRDMAYGIYRRPPKERSND